MFQKIKFRDKLLSNAVLNCNKIPGFKISTIQVNKKQGFFQGREEAPSKLFVLKCR
jgi:hypothetical protein